RPDWKSKHAWVYVGLIQIGKHGAGDRMAAQGAGVVDRAITARDFAVDLAHAPPPAGTVYVPHAIAPITIDGVGIEAGWTGAATSPDFATAEGSPDPIGRAFAKMTWD